MSKAIARAIYFTDWEIGETESWFSRMSEQGMHLKSLNRRSAIFDTGDGEKYRYRICLGKRGAYNSLPEAFGEYAEMGWELVCEHGTRFVYRSLEASNAREIYGSDKLEQWLSKNSWKERIWTNLILLAAAMLFIYAFFWRKYPILILVESRSNAQILLFVGILQTYYLGLKGLFQVKKLRKALSDGTEINHKKSWEKLLQRRKICSVLCSLVVVIFFAATTYYLVRHSAKTIPSNFVDSRVIRLSEIEDNAALVHREGREYRGIDWSNYTSGNWSPFAPTILRIVERGVIPGRNWETVGPHTESSMEYQPHYEFDLYRLSAVWLAKLLFRDLLDWSVGDATLSYFRYSTSYAPEKIAPNEVFDHPEFDKLFVREETVVPEMHIFAMKGSNVVRVKYIGEENLETVLEEISKLFERLMS